MTAPQTPTSARYHEAAVIIQELLRLAQSNWRGYSEWAAGRSLLFFDPLTDAPQTRVRQIGEQLFRLDGTVAMHGALAILTEEIAGTPPPWAPPDMRGAICSELNQAWHGIGDWQA